MLAGIKSAFPEGLRGGGVPGPSHWHFGKQWLGKPITFGLSKGNKRFFHSIRPEMEISGDAAFKTQLAKKVRHPFQDRTFKRLSADRDIVPEASVEKLDVAKNGAGATNAIQQFINNASLSRDLVDQTLLTELNDIMRPDAEFTGIVVQQHRQSQWEIYLAEKEKGLIALSHTGSGLKTIILVLVFLFLIPKAENRNVSDYFFGFEELENNLHPSLIRRLLLYLRNFSEKHGCYFFLTTHSNISIDLFNRDSLSQVVHVTHDGVRAKARTVKAYIRPVAKVASWRGNVKRPAPPDQKPAARLRMPATMEILAP